MKILLGFATYSSGTDLASALVEKQLSESGFSIERKDIREVSHDSFQDYDLIIFASPSWRTRLGDGHPHEFFLDFMDKMKGKQFQAKQFAIFGLGDKAYTHFCGAVDHLESFVNEIGGALIVPSLRIDGFYFDQKTNEEYLRVWVGKLVSTLNN